MDDKIEEFAAGLLREVRDASIRECDSLLQPHALSPQARRWREAAAGDPRALQRMMVADVVDTVIANLLDAVDHERLRLRFVAEDGTEVDLATVGKRELTGWYVASWRAKSQERYFDDDADLGVP
jgi:hypothetical protein